MIRKICIVTGTRAEYGLLRRVILRFIEEDYDVRVAVTGSHLSSDFGNTWREIVADGIKIDKKIDIITDDNSAVGISESMATALSGFAHYFNESKPELVIVLGDRYELFAVSAAAMIARIPIAHLHGGEVTEGAVDEYIRHSITKMSYLHFTSCEEYRERVIQLGESPDRVFNVGGMGVENILNIREKSKEELFADLKLDFSKDTPYAVITFHPVTLEDSTYMIQIDELLKAIDEFKNINFIFTRANADEGGRIINKHLEEYVLQKTNAVLFDSLGVLNYLSAVKHAIIVIGNSSSGLLEVPSFGIPTINIGDRQKGRIQATSVINCMPEKDSIVQAIECGLSEKFRTVAKKTRNPYGDGHTSEKIVDIVGVFFKENKFNLKKHFYDIGGISNVSE